MDLLCQSVNHLFEFIVPCYSNFLGISHVSVVDEPEIAHCVISKLEGDLPAERVLKEGENVGPRALILKTLQRLRGSAQGLFREELLSLAIIWALSR